MDKGEKEEVAQEFWKASLLQEEIISCRYKMTKVPGGGESQYYLIDPMGKIIDSAHEDSTYYLILLNKMNQFNLCLSF